MTGEARCVQGDVQVVALDRLQATAIFTVDRSEEVFAGHYPGFAIFPGVCLVEVVDEAAKKSLKEVVQLTVIESIRFLSPVYPGDELSIAVAWSESVDGLILRAVLENGRTVCARARLRYRTERPQVA